MAREPEAQVDAESRDRPATNESSWPQLIGRLVTLAEDDSELRGLLRAAAEFLLAQLGPPDSPTAAVSEENAPEAAGTSSQLAIAHPEIEASIASDAPVADTGAVGTDDPLQSRIERVLDERAAERSEATLSESDKTPPAVDSGAEAQSVADAKGRMLSHLAADANLKAEAARWVGERQRRLALGADYASEIAPGDREMLSKAQTANVYLWMCRRDAPVPPDVSDWDQLAGNFEALADALRLNALVLEEAEISDSIDQTMALLAEAQSALRLAVDELDERTDETQRETYYWLKRTTDRRRIYLSQHMRLNDPADPMEWGSLQERCAMLYDELQGHLDARRKEGRQWGRLRYHLQRTHGADEISAKDDWTKALDAVDQLVAVGVAPSSVKLRDALLPCIDEIPDDVDASKNALLALREIDRYLASREAEAARSRDESGSVTTPSKEEEQVRALLAGRAVVLIGGIQRPSHKTRIEEAFQLSELVWLDGGVVSYTDFEPAIARADVAAVILLIRWSSHGYGDVKEYCDTYDKPLIRVPAGYNPKQLAHQIIEQGAVRLGAIPGGSA